MTGEEALVFTRERFALANGDFGRVQRQHAWMKAIALKVTEDRTDLLKMSRFLLAVTKSVSVDEGLTFDKLQRGPFRIAGEVRMFHPKSVIGGARRL